MAAEARAAVDAGTRSVHRHPYDDNGQQTFAAQPYAATLLEVRAACPGIPIPLIIKSPPNTACNRWSGTEGQSCCSR
jgi:uncharacterized protein (DUF849 family)